MHRKLFIRNIQAREQLELFIVSAISSLLLLRYYLYLTGYPQVGGGSLHIAHMLYGGLLMLIAIVLMLSFLGRRVARVGGVLGGAGFGIFIDEIGKFLTKDNNYFFRPAIGIIYAIFVLLYLALSFLTRRERLTSTEYQLNALSGLEEAVLREMDEREKRAVAAMLQRANPSSNITKQLRIFLDSVDANEVSTPMLAKRVYLRFSTWYEHIWKSRGSNGLVRTFFIAEIALFVLAVVLAVYNNVDSVTEFFSGHADYGHSLVIGQAIGTAIAAVFASVGMYRLRVSRIEAFEWFRRATLANLLFTEFFIFSRIQFGAMASFIFNLVLLGLINFVLGHERRASPRQSA
jgi:hypothetical protein